MNRSQTRYSKIYLHQKPKGFAMLHSALLLSCALFVLSSAPHFVQAQTQTAISGRVTDQTSAAIVRADVELRNTANSETRRAVTDDAGQFSFSPVSPGKYKITVSMKGFRQLTVASVNANEAKSYDLDLELEPGDVLETVVVTGTRSEQEIGKIASAVSVISQEEIQQGQRVSTLEESLKRVSGVRVEDELGGNGSRVRIIVRGAGTRANSPAGSGVRGVKVLVDGLPKNNAGGSAQDLTNIDLQSAQRIEVLKGPSSVLYGNQSGGVVNILTENPPTKPTIAYRQTFGAYGLFKEHLKGGAQHGRFGFFGSVYRNDQDGYRRQSSFHNTGFHSKLNFDINPRSNVLLIFDYDNNYQQSPGPLTDARFRQDPRQADPTFVTNDVFAVVKEFRFGAVYHTEVFGQDDLEVTTYVAPRNIGYQDVLVCGVCAAAVYAKPVEDRNIKRGDKVAVRCSADRLLSEFKAETSSYFPRVLVKFHYAFGPLKRATIDASVSSEMYAFVK